MKKTQVKAAKVAVLGYSAALAVLGSTVSMDAAAESCTGGSAAVPVKCGFLTGDSAPWAEGWSFTGSNNVTINDSISAYGYGACAFHANGTKSFGLTMEGGSMTILPGKKSTANETSGCTA